MRSIRNATAGDLASIAKCHMKAFPRALSSAMGAKYLSKMLEWYLVDHRAFLFFIEEDGVCCGYCGGLKFDGTTRVGSASSMIQHSFSAAVRTFLLRPWLFLHPEFIHKYRLAARNVVKRLKKLLIKESAPRPVRGQSLPDPYAGLVVIGVDADFQGRGYGTLLLQEFEAVSQSFGFHTLSLTVKTNNDKAIKSYVRNGWVTVDVNGNSTSMQKRLAEMRIREDFPGVIKK